MTTRYHSKTIKVIIDLQPSPGSESEPTHRVVRAGPLRLVAVHGAVARVAALAVALVGRGRVDAGGEGVAVVEAQAALLHVGAGGVGPHAVLLVLPAQVLQLHLHLHGPRRGRGLGLGAGGAEGTHRGSDTWEGLATLVM